MDEEELEMMLQDEFDTFGERPGPGDEAPPG